MSELHIKFGELLQLERERRGLSHSDLASELKISEENLIAIEEGAPEQLPSDLYYNLFSKSYAEYLGIDFAATMEAIKQDMGGSSAPPRDAAESGETGEDSESNESEEASRDRGPGRKLVLIGGLVIAAFVVFIAVYKLFLEDALSSGNHEAPGTEAEAVESEADNEARTEAYENYDWAHASEIVTDSLRMTLRAREESWATVLADGDTALYQNLTPERTYLVAARYRLLVSIGVPRLVEITLDGRPAFLADAESGRISRVEVNQVNRGDYKEPPRPKSFPNRPRQKRRPRNPRRHRVRPSGGAGAAAGRPERSGLTEYRGHRRTGCSTGYNAAAGRAALAT